MECIREGNVQRGEEEEIVELRLVYIVGGRGVKGRS